MWTSIISLVANVLVQQLMQPKAPETPAAEVRDVDAPTADEGRPIPVVFGTVMMRGANTVWYGDLRTTPIKSSSGGGKK